MTLECLSCSQSFAADSVTPPPPSELHHLLSQMSLSAFSSRPSSLSLHQTFQECSLSAHQIFQESLWVPSPGTGTVWTFEAPAACRYDCLDM